MILAENIPSMIPRFADSNPVDEDHAPGQAYLKRYTSVVSLLPCLVSNVEASAIQVFNRDPNYSTSIFPQKPVCDAARKQ